MGRYSNTYIPNIIKRSPSNINQIGWELRTVDNLGEFRYKNDQFELVYDDGSVVIIAPGNLIVNENYTIEASDSYTIEAGDTIILNSTNEVNITSNTNNVNITSVTNNITLSAGGNEITWNGTRFVTDTETVAYLSDIPSNITTQGNVFNGVSQLVQTDGSGRLPSLDGSQLTNLVVGGTTQNVNLSIQAFDEGTVSGNARGINSIDLQTDRTLATQVASGANSIIAGGIDNTASGPTSVVLGGNENTASGAGSIICGGGFNIASATSSAVLSGTNNTASGISASVVGGNDNTSVGQLSATFGIGNTSNSYSELVIGSYSENVAGTSGSIVSTDPVFRIGSGTSDLSRFDAFRVNKDGTTHIPLKLYIDSAGTKGSTTGIEFGDTGNVLIYEDSGDDLFVQSNGVITFRNTAVRDIRFDTNGIYFVSGTSPLFKDTSVSNSSPSLIPNNTHLGSGVGGASQGVSLICNFVETFTCTPTGIFAWNIKSGASELASGAALNELWIDTADNSIKIRLV